MFKKNQSKLIIQVKNLSKKYQDFLAVDQISFKVKEGEIFAFLGPNGAGKSTTIKMLTTVLNPTSGEILINGFDPRTHADQVRQSFGIVFQDSSIDEELTAFENMQLHCVLYHIPANEMNRKIAELLKLVDLETKKNQLVKTYSGGMKRRLEIARGLLHRPKIFFLDEPTLGLDPQTRNQIWNYLKKLNQNRGTTIFFTTHYMQEAEQAANYINIIDQGKIVAQGTAKDLIKQANTKSLEDAYLKITGYHIREELATNLDHLRNMRQRHGRNH